MWELNLWFRIVYNKQNTPENIEEIRTRTENASFFEDVLRANFADLINQITIKYVGKANSDLIKWFLDNFIK